MQTFSHIETGIIDSHAHVMREFFADEQESVIKRALDANVKQLVNPGINGASVPELLELTERHANLYIAVGLHPHEATSWSAELQNDFSTALRKSKVVAVGECGLDYYYNNSPQAEQETALRAQIELSLQFRKPLIIHCRDAWQDLARIFDDYSPNLQGVFHCFTGDPETVELLRKYDFYFSFSGIVTFPNAKKLQAAAKLVADDRLMVETDCPFLAPQAVRGQRNEPAYVWYVAEKLAALRNQPIEAISALCCENTRRLFALPLPL